MRRWLNNHPAITGAILLPVVAVAVWYLLDVNVGQEQPDTDEAWYYDPVEDRYFIDALDVPPVQSPWGHASPRAFFFGCGGCADGQRFLGYYYKLSEEAKQRVQQNPDLKPAAMGPSFPGRLYSLDGQTWREGRNPQEAGVGEALADRCQPPDYLRRCPEGPPDN